MHNELWLKTLTINLIYLSSFALISRMHLKASWNLLKKGTKIDFIITYFYLNINNNFYFSKRFSDRHHHSDLRSTRSMRGRRRRERKREKKRKRLRERER